MINTGHRPTIVAIDDYEEVLHIYREEFPRILGNEYDFVFCSDSVSASNFVHDNANRIVGYVQDVMRSDRWGDRGGIQFFNGVIDVLTPSAKCLFVSAVADLMDVDVIPQSVQDRVRWFRKAAIIGAAEDPLREPLNWLVTPATPSEEPANEASKAILNLVAPAWQSLCDYIVKNDSHLHAMSPHDFELLAGEIFRSAGWDVEFTSRTRDGGYDIIAIKRAFPTNLRILVEAKRFSPNRTVGVDIVRSLYGVKQSQAASQLVLVTSSFVSLDAKKEFARVVPWELDFVERDKILAWCRRHSSLSLLGTFN